MAMKKSRIILIVFLLLVAVVVVISQLGQRIPSQTVLRLEIQQAVQLRAARSRLRPGALRRQHDREQTREGE